MSHTPGPWKCWQGPGDTKTNYWRIRTSSSELDGDTLRGYCGRANAHLIAAAPDLLEVCKEIAARWNDPYGIDACTIQHVIDAIAKAEGKTQ